MRLRTYTYYIIGVREPFPVSLNEGLISSATPFANWQRRIAELKQGLVQKSLTRKSIRHLAESDQPFPFIKKGGGISITAIQLFLWKELDAVILMILSNCPLIRARVIGSDSGQKRHRRGTRRTVQLF